jgi:uncharacterized membrane protein HdeD (DUF308 family)
MWWTFMIRGVLAGILGLCAIFWPSATVGILVILVGIFCLVEGTSGVVGAIRASERGPGLAQGLIGIAVGMILLFWPGATVRTLLVVFGAWLLFTGITQILSARGGSLERDDRNFVISIGGLVSAIGVVLIVWPGTGVVAISWLIAIAALVLSALLILLALRLKRIR